MMISLIWEKMESKHFDGSAGNCADGQEDIKGRACAIMDIRGLTRIGACAGTVRSAEDLRALDKPGGEFHKSYQLLTMMISQIWDKTESKHFDDSTGNCADGQEDFRGRACAIMDICGLTRIGACAGTIRPAEDLRALDKPGGQSH